MEELQKKLAILEQLLQDEGLEIESQKIKNERLERQLAQLNLTIDQQERELETKNEECLQLQQDLLKVEDEKKQLLFDLETFSKIDEKWQNELHKVSIEHELRGDQITHAIAELQESLEARMPAKRRKKSEIPEPKKKRGKLELNLC